MATKLQKLLFVDTNIWLDFYRARNETGLALLSHAESVASKIIVTYQLESEFKKNRQTAILEGMQELKAPAQIPRPGIFSDAKASALLSKSIKEADRRVKSLKAKLTKVLENPAVHDPVYKACQRIFHKQDDLVLTREDKLRHLIRRKAFRRFLHGCPPRKKNDTSIGDAINWEWMIHCANASNAELVIVTRDSDFGVHFENRAYINDHLKQEFAERVSKKRKLLLYARLSDALKHFEVPVTKQEEEAEAEILSRTPEVVPSRRSALRIVCWSSFNPSTFERPESPPSLPCIKTPRLGADGRCWLTGRSTVRPAAVRGFGSHSPTAAGHLGVRAQGQPWHTERQLFPS